MQALRIGSEEHKRLFCRTFVETHDPFRPEEILWPDLDEESLERMTALPVWGEAARTESATALKVQTLGRMEKDPILSEAISLQGYEEGRHATVIRLLADRYGIPIDPYESPAPPKNPTWAFLRTGYGECLDSFFAFGLFAIGKQTQFFHPKLIGLFDTIMQEEARHILFLVNWAAYRRARTPLAAKPVFDVRRAWNIAAQAADRIRGALAMGAGNSQDGFAMKTHSSLGVFSLRSFFELCLSENERRLAPYDERLLRPSLVPRMVRFVLPFLRRSRRAGDSGVPERIDPAPPTEGAQ